MMKTLVINSLCGVQNGEIVCTSNRRLQNYLYILGIKSLSYEKNWDGYTVWAYRVTDELRSAVEDFASMQKRRARMISSASA